MKSLRSTDVGTIPVGALHRLAGMLTQPTTCTAHGINIHARVEPWQPLQYEKLVDASTLSEFPSRWRSVEKFAPSSQYAITQELVLAKQSARDRLRKGQFGDFIWPITMDSPDQRFAALHEVLLPAFFEEFPLGEVHLVRYDQRLNDPLALLSVLQRHAS